MSRTVLANRRQTLIAAGSALAAAVGTSVVGQAATPGAQPATPVVATPLPPAVLDIISQAKYDLSRWGIYVADRESGEPLIDFNAGERFLGASTTKLFSTTAALHFIGADFQFETPIYRTGEVADGVLTGNLVLVASGDLTLGGRTTPEGTLAFVPIDHINAVALDGATLTSENPLAGIDELAAQVAASGITRVEGDVAVDDRLFPAMAKDGYVLSPVWVNDNLIDITVTPGAEGEPATVSWRPESAAYKVVSTVLTGAPGIGTALSVGSPAAGAIAITGEIAADAAPVLRVFQVEDPAAFLRTVLIEALSRAGVSVTGPPVGPNPVALLPPVGSYASAEQVAVLESLPFSENIKLINKVSHNQHADMLIFLMALQAGETSFEAGMAQIRAFLETIGLDPTLVSLADGRGNSYTDRFSPHTVSRLLELMVGQNDFDVFDDSLPIFGVDGSEATLVSPDSPVAGNARAKSGTTVDGDLLNLRPLLMTRCLAGYMTGTSGRELVFAVYVNDVPMAKVTDLFAVRDEQGVIVEHLFAIT